MAIDISATGFCVDFNDDATTIDDWIFSSNDPAGDHSGDWDKAEADPYSHLRLITTLNGEGAGIVNAYGEVEISGLDPYTTYRVTFRFYNISFCYAFCGDDVVMVGCTTTTANAHAFGEVDGDASPSQWVQRCWSEHGVGDTPTFPEDIEIGVCSQRARGDGTMTVRFGLKDVDSAVVAECGLLSFCLTTLGGYAYLL